jgi:glycosyltransferase domain-containing protein
MYAKNVSIVVITHQRPQFVRTFVKSLNDMRFAGHLILAESSNAETFQETANEVGTVAPTFRVTHLSVPKLQGQTPSSSMNSCLKAGVAKIDTKYALLSCDDDIPLPDTLGKFEKFLDENPDYNGVTGDYVWYDTDEKARTFSKRPKAIENLLSFLWRFENTRGRRSGRNMTFSIESNTAGERLNEYVDKLFHTMFTLVRAETLNKIIPDNADQIQFPHFYADYAWMFAIAAAGKIKTLPYPYIIRLYHGENLSTQNEKHPFPTYTQAMLGSAGGSDSKLFVRN